MPHYQQLLFGCANPRAALAERNSISQQPRAKAPELVSRPPCGEPYTIGRLTGQPTRY